MALLDVINCCFEAGGALLLWANVRRLLRDRTVRGVSLLPVLWWNIWGFWNVAYYHGLGQTLSMIAGSAVVLANTVWLFLAWRFRK